VLDIEFDAKDIVYARYRPPPEDVFVSCVTSRLLALAMIGEEVCAPSTSRSPTMRYPRTVAHDRSKMRPVIARLQGGQRPSRML